jgi:mycoketide-CoA synthase
VAGQVLVPGTAMLELALHAGQRLGLGVVRELTLELPWVLERNAAAQLQLSVSAPQAQGDRRVELYSRTGEGPWSRHASGFLSAGSETDELDAAAFAELRSWPPEPTQALPVAELYPRLRGFSLEYGPAFQGLTELRRANDVAYGRVVLPPALFEKAQHYGVHPALLDAALHPLFALDLLEGLALPFAWSHVQLHAAGAGELRTRVERQRDGDGLSVCVHVSDGHGQPVLSAKSLSIRSARPEQLHATAGKRAEDLYRVVFQPVLVSTPKTLDMALVSLAGSTLRSALTVPAYTDLDALLAELKPGAAPACVVVDASAGSHQSELAAAAHEAGAWGLALLQRFLAEPRLE